MESDIKEPQAIPEPQIQAVQPPNEPPPPVATSAIPENPEPPKKKKAPRIVDNGKPPVWKLNPDGSREQVEAIPFQPTNPAIMWRADELIRWGMTPEQAKAKIIEEVQNGELDCSPPKAGQSSRPASVPQQEPTQQQADKEEAYLAFLEHHYAYLQAYVRLEAGQINGLPLNELENIASLCVKPVKSFEAWAMTRHGIDYSVPDVQETTPEGSQPDGK